MPIEVEAAVYGAVQGSVDVTNKVQSIIDSGQCKFKADSEVFGDPAPGYRKHFVALYRSGDYKKAVACKEHQEVIFSKQHIWVIE
ncbi:hypothetical protein [Roseibium sp. RKSG952]|uniref:hypothetical protein n=1 Tax=Roseibium sp. RKSG952 TaxID=2529384 RepID=UPI0012BCF8A8|nr:hypothetical protein [Roseibium sp. RKSG952]MTH94655.1 hypothetical protein [Roseibium sp. RKSG952]